VSRCDAAGVEFKNADVLAFKMGRGAQNVPEFAMLINSSMNAWDHLAFEFTEINRSSGVLPDLTELTKMHIVAEPDYMSLMTNGRKVCHINYLGPGLLIARLTSEETKGTVVDLDAKRCAVEGSLCDACCKQHQQVIRQHPPGEKCKTVQLVVVAGDDPARSARPDGGRITGVQLTKKLRKKILTAVLVKQTGKKIKDVNPSAFACPLWGTCGKLNYKSAGVANKHITKIHCKELKDGVVSLFDVSKSSARPHQTAPGKRLLKRRRRAISRSSSEEDENEDEEEVEAEEEEDDQEDEKEQVDEEKGDLQVAVDELVAVLLEEHTLGIATVISVDVEAQTCWLHWLGQDVELETVELLISQGVFKSLFINPSNKGLTTDVPVGEVWKKSRDKIGFKSILRVGVQLDRHNELSKADKVALLETFNIHYM
jgi:hypothetical protein